MPKSLIIGISDSLSHENNVRDSFLTYAQEGWGADILMGSNNESLIDDPNVVGVIPMGGFIFLSEVNELVQWLDNHPNEYPIVIFSYRSFPMVMERIVWEKDRLLFMPQTSTSWGNKKNNAIMVGVGEEQAELVAGYSEGFYKADQLIESRQLTPSYVTPSVAGICASLVDAGLSTKEAMIAIREHFTEDWTERDGYGKFSDLIPINSIENVQPPNSLVLNLTYALFYGQDPDFIRIYRDDEIVFEGNGTQKTIGAAFVRSTGSQLYYEIDARLRDFFDLENDEAGEYEFDIRSVINGVESEKTIYATQSYTLTENRIQIWKDQEADEEDEEDEEDENDEEIIDPEPEEPTQPVLPEKPQIIKAQRQANKIVLEAFPIPGIVRWRAGVFGGELSEVGEGLEIDFETQDQAYTVEVVNEFDGKVSEVTRTYIPAVAKQSSERLVMLDY